MVNQSKDIATVPVASAICYHVTHAQNVLNRVKPYNFQNLSTYSVPYNRQDKLHLITVLRGSTYY